MKDINALVVCALRKLFPLPYPPSYELEPVPLITRRSSIVNHIEHHNRHCYYHHNYILRENNLF